MIDRKVFAFEMTVLRDRFGRRDMTDETIARYLDFLDPLMETAEFQAASRAVFNRDTFWPSPQRFVEAIRGDPKQEAVKEWDRLLEAASKGQPGELSEAGKAALRAVGGWSRVAYAQDGSLPALRRSFLDSYGAKTAPEPMSLPGEPELAR